MKSKFKRSGISPGILAIWVLAAMVVITAFTFVGCGKNPVAPDQTNSAVDVNDPFLKNKVDLTKESKEITRNGIGWVTPNDGGVVRLNWGGRKTRLVFKSGTVESNILIRTSTTAMKLPFKGGFKLLELDFGPDGTKFLKPVKLVVNASWLKPVGLRKGNNRTLSLHWFNPESGDWEIIQSAKVKKGKVIFYLTHFSRFGISER